MGMTIDASALGGAFEDLSDETAREAANRAFSESNEVLLEAGDEQEWDVFPVVQSAQPPRWVDDLEGYAFVYPHRASIFFEDGTAPHEILPDQAEALAFEWPKMAGEPFGETGQTWDEVFADTWPTVFLPRVSHPGMPAVGFVRRGMQAAARWLRRGR